MSKKDLQDKVVLLAEALLQATEKNSILRKRLENAKKDARTDYLTGLGNMRYATEEVGRLQSLAGRNQLLSSLVCAAFIDMDNLKTINDTQGHATGDRALLVLVEALKSATRTNDIVARIGGDEFVIIGLFKDKKEINVFKKRVQTALNGIAIKKAVISTSIGYSYAKLNSKFNFEKMLSKSDKRMQQIKKQKKKTG